MKRWAMVMVVGFSMLAPAAGWARSKHADAGPQRTGPLSGMVGFLNGTATLETAQGKKFPLAPGAGVGEGDTIVTGADGRIKIMLSDDSVVNLGPQTTFKLEKVSVQNGKREFSLKVVSGKFLASVAKWFGAESSFQVTTPNAVAGVRGTTLWGDVERDAICALYGTITVKSVKGGDTTEKTVEAGHCVTKMKDGQTNPLTPDAATVQTYLGEVRPDIK